MLLCVYIYVYASMYIYSFFLSVYLSIYIKSTLALKFIDNRNYYFRLYISPESNAVQCLHSRFSTSVSWLIILILKLHIQYMLLYAKSTHTLILDNLQIKELSNLTEICMPPIHKSTVEAMKSECRSLTWCVVGSIQQITRWKKEFTEVNVYYFRGGKD